MLEQLRLNELPDDDARRAQQLVATNPAIAARVRAIQTSDMAIAEAGLIELMAAGVIGRLQIDQRERPRRSTWRPLLLWGVPALSVVVLAVVVYPLIRQSNYARTESVKRAPRPRSRSTGRRPRAASDCRTTMWPAKGTSFALAIARISHTVRFCQSTAATW
jgi:hypothetical protein